MCSAVGLMSQPVTRQEGLALSTGSSAEPQPQPISAMCCGGWATAKEGNSSIKYRFSLKKRAWLCCA